MGPKATTITTAVRIKNKKITDLTKVKNLELLPLFTRLQIIELQHNKLSMVPSSICADLQRSPKIIDYLQELNLSFNRFSRLPEEIFLLINIRKLNLEHNLLVEFSGRFLSFYRLEELNLRHNNIKNLPWAMNRLKKLTSLNLQENELDYIPNTVGKLKLKHFYVIPNPLKAIENDEFLLACHHGPIEDVLDHVLLQEISKNYPFTDEIRAEKERKEAKNEFYTQEQRIMCKVLKLPDGFKAMEAHMAKEHSTENILFWKSVHEYISNYSSNVEITNSELVEDAKKIFYDFISEDSQYTLNLPAEVTSQLRRMFTDTFVFPKGINQWVFMPAYKAIVDLMCRDTFRRFKTTQEGSILVNLVLEKDKNRKNYK